MHLALVDFPVAFGVESHLEETVFRIVTLAAAGADQVAAPGGALVVVVFGDGEGGAAAAGDEEHAEGSIRGGRILLSGRALLARRRTLWSG